MRNSIVKSKVDEIQEFNCQFVISTLFQHRQQRIGGGGGGESSYLLLYGQNNTKQWGINCCYFRMNIL